MDIQATLMERSNNRCELCNATSELDVYPLAPGSDGNPEQSVLLCQTCRHQIDNRDATDMNHWRCLNDSMWSQVPAVQVMIWRQLTYLSSEAWAQDLLAMLYLDDEVLQWAQAGVNESGATGTVTVDSNGTELAAGDTVTLIKDLDVKGAGFTAKRGTAVRTISLTDNPQQIEGRVNGVRIVLLTKFLKKAS